MSAAIKAGALYGAVVFLCGFALGTARILVVAPWVGEVVAVLLETPVILAASWIASRWCADRFEAPATAPRRLAMAIALLMTAELGVSTCVFHRSLAEDEAGYRGVAGAIGLAGQFIFAWFPLAQTTRRWNGLTMARAIHIAVKYGAGDGELFDTFLPERITRHTFQVFGPLIVLGLVL